MEQNGFADDGGGASSKLDKLNPLITNFLTFSVFFIIIFQFYGKGGKKRKVTFDCDTTKWTGVDAISGPKSWDPTGIIGNLFEFLPIEGAFTKGLSFCEKYGDTFKITGLGQTFVVLNSGPVVQALCKSSDMGHLTKSPEIYDLMKPFVTNGVLVSKGKFWQHERKILLKSQSFKSLKAYVPMLNRHCRMFVQNLENMFEDGKPHEINGLINSSFIKVISEMITGFSGGNSDEFNQYHHNFQIWKESMVYRILHPWFLIPPVWKLNPLSWKTDKAIEEMIDFARRRIREHKQRRSKLNAKADDQQGELNDEGTTTTPNNKTEFRSVLDELIDGGVDDDQIVDEINTMLFGGHETGATVIHIFCFLMALHPEIQKECQKEIDELFEDPLSCKNDDITFDAVSSNLKLVERCILETLRMFPPVFTFLRKLNTPLKINHNDQDIVLPAGTNAVVFPYGLHRNPTYYPDPEKFNPERFLPEEYAKRHAYAYVPFSAGPRNCLGLKFAMMEMKTVVAYTLRHFTITTTDRMEDIPMLPYITTTPAKDYTFNFIKREM